MRKARLRAATADRQTFPLRMHTHARPRTGMCAHAGLVDSSDAGVPWTRSCARSSVSVLSAAQRCGTAPREYREADSRFLFAVPTTCVVSCLAVALRSNRALLEVVITFINDRSHQIHWLPIVKDVGCNLIFSLHALGLSREGLRCERIREQFHWRTP